MGRVNFARTTMTGTGYYARINIYPVRRTSKKRGAKRKPTSEVQAVLNQKNSEKQLADEIHLNFTPDDDEVSLDYRDGTMPVDYDDAKRIIRNFLRRYKPVWSAITGRPVSEFKYIIVTECSKKGRFHHHCIFSGGVDARTIQPIWQKGRTTTDPLKFDENGIRGLTHYISKQRLGYRRWMASRNLKKPAPKQSDYRMTMKDLKYMNEHPEDVSFIEERFPGWKVSPRGVFSERIASELKEADGKEVKGVEAMPFVEFQLYREDCPYYERTKDGGIIYKYGFGAGFRIPDIGFPEGYRS